MRLAYLVLLLLAVGGWFFADGRRNLGKSARQALVWGLLFLGIIAAYGLWDDIRTELTPRQSLVAPGVIDVPRAPDGHYYLTLGINGTPVRFVVDTGATQMVLTRDDALRAGIDLSELRFTGRAQTANGTVATARVRLAEVTLGPITDRSVPAAVNGGEMQGSLLGMEYLQRFDRLSIESNRLVLER